MSEQPTLDFLAECEAGERAIGANHAVTRDDETNRIRGIGATYCASSMRVADYLRDLRVRPSLAPRNSFECLPHELLKRGAAFGERKIETPPLAREVREYLVAGVPHGGPITFKLKWTEAFGQ
jgi:hypothetical protein